MISKTLGSGGDFADWDYMMLYLDGTTFSDDIDIQLISDINMSSFAGWDANIKSTTHIKITIHSDTGKRTISGFDATPWFILNNSNCEIEIYDINFVGVDKNNIGEIDFGLDNYPPPVVEPNTNTKVTIHHCYFKYVYVDIMAGYFSFDLYELKFFNCGMIIDKNNGSNGTKTGLIENCTFYDTDSMGGQVIIYDSDTPNTADMVCNNVVSITGGYSYNGVIDTSSGSTYSNCADDDGSFPTGTDIYHNITINTEFVSLDHTNGSFLKITNDGILYINGKTPTITTTDLDYTSLPNNVGRYPIGCYSIDADFLCDFSGVPTNGIHPLQVSFTDESVG
jgi:hypothetical protein